MRTHTAVAALGFLIMSDGWATAQAPELAAPSTAPTSTESSDIDFKAKIRATEKVREELIQRFNAESAKKNSKDAKRDAELHALSGTVCSGCGEAQHRAPSKRKSPKHAAPKPQDDAPDEGPIVDDLH